MIHQDDYIQIFRVYIERELDGEIHKQYSSKIFKDLESAKESARALSSLSGYLTSGRTVDVESRYVRKDSIA